MPSDAASELIRSANPVAHEPTLSIDDAWDDLVVAHERTQLAADDSSRRNSSSWTHPRRLFAVAAAVLLIAGVSAFIGVRNTSTPSLTNSFARAFGVVNANAATTNGFTSVPSSPQGMNDLTCPTSQVCYLESTNAQPGVTPYNPVTTAYKTIDGGATWKPLSLSVTGNADTSMSCSSVTVCSFGIQTSPTTPQTPPAKGTAQLMLTTTDGGETWSRLVVSIKSILGGDSALDGSLKNVQGMWTQLQCFSAVSCIAVALVHSDQPEASDDTEGVLRTVIMRTDDGGATWASTVLPWSKAIDGSPGWSNAQPLTLSCATETDCVGLSSVFHSVVDNIQKSNVLVWRSNDGGVKWKINWAPAPALNSDLRVTCPTTKQCYAPVTVGSSLPGEKVEIMTTNNGGVNWTFTAPSTGGVTSKDEFNSVSCTSASTCWVSGEVMTRGLDSSRARIWATKNAGKTWIAVPIQIGLGTVFQVDCNAPASCLAVAQPPYKDGQTVPNGPLPGEILSNQNG